MFATKEKDLDFSPLLLMCALLINPFYLIPLPVSINLQSVTFAARVKKTFLGSKLRFRIRTVYIQQVYLSNKSTYPTSSTSHLAGAEKKFYLQHKERYRIKSSFSFNNGSVLSFYNKIIIDHSGY